MGFLSASVQLCCTFLSVRNLPGARLRLPFLSPADVRLSCPRHRSHSHNERTPQPSLAPPPPRRPRCDRRQVVQVPPQRPSPQPSAQPSRLAPASGEAVLDLSRTERRLWGHRGDRERVRAVRCCCRRGRLSLRAIPGAAALLLL